MIRVDIYHRGDWYRHARIDGQFAYPSPGLVWRQNGLSKTTTVNLSSLPAFADGTQADVAWLDEGKYQRYQLFAQPPGPHRPTPVVYNAVYPTLNQSTYESRVVLAREQADLVLVDHDDLGRWERDTGLPCRRLAYSVDETRYRDRGLRRDIDVGFYCVYAFNSERPAMDEWLAAFCERKGYRFATTEGQNVGTEYAELLARTKVVIHLTRTPRTRPPRIFDTAACRTALLSNPMPAVSGEHFEQWVHYVPFGEPHSRSYRPFTGWKPLRDEHCGEVIAGLEWLLDEGHWEHVAERAHEYVMACHTWRTRAVQLRGILLDVFPGIVERPRKEFDDG